MIGTSLNSLSGYTRVIDGTNFGHPTKTIDFNMMAYKLYHRILTSFSDSSVLNNSSSSSTSAAAYSYDNGEYIFDISYSKQLTSIAATSSDRHLYLYDSSNLQVKSKISCHQNRISHLETSNYDDNIILTSSEDQTVKIWDMRHNNDKPVLQYAMDDEVQCASIGFGGNLLAVGAGSTIFFYDVRCNVASRGKQDCLGEYSDIHTDIVTQLKFNDVHDSIIASGSEDGLICTFDTSVDPGQEAVQSIMNTEQSIRKLGFVGQGNVALFSISSIETFSLWHHPTAQRIGEFKDIRESLGMDYLVHCSYNSHNNNVHLVVGKFDGLGGVINVEPEKLTFQSHLRGGHNGTIRCATFNNETNYMITGAEDSKICIWSPDQDTDSHASPVLENGNSHRNRKILPSSYQKSSRSLKDSPY